VTQDSGVTGRLPDRLLMPGCGPLANRSIRSSMLGRRLIAGALYPAPTKVLLTDRAGLTAVSRRG
jgi:hypothetical protein